MAGTGVWDSCQQFIEAAERRQRQTCPSGQLQPLAGRPQEQARLQRSSTPQHQQQQHWEQGERPPRASSEPLQQQQPERSSSDGWEHKMPTPFAAPHLQHLQPERSNSDGWSLKMPTPFGAAYLQQQGFSTGSLPSLRASLPATATIPSADGPMHQSDAAPSVLGQRPSQQQASLEQRMSQQRASLEQRLSQQRATSSGPSLEQRLAQQQAALEQQRSEQQEWCTAASRLLQRPPEQREEQPEWARRQVQWAPRQRCPSCEEPLPAGVQAEACACDQPPPHKRASVDSLGNEMQLSTASRASSSRAISRAGSQASMAPVVESERDMLGIAQGLGLLPASQPALDAQPSRVLHTIASLPSGHRRSDESSQSQELRQLMPAPSGGRWQARRQPQPALQPRSSGPPASMEWAPGAVPPPPLAQPSAQQAQQVPEGQPSAERAVQFAQLLLQQQLAGTMGGPPPAQGPWVAQLAELQRQASGRQQAEAAAQLREQRRLLEEAQAEQRKQLEQAQQAQLLQLERAHQRWHAPQAPQWRAAPAPLQVPLPPEQHAQLPPKEQQRMFSLYAQQQARLAEQRAEQQRWAEAAARLVQQPQHERW